MGRIEEALQPELAAELKASLASDAQLLLPPIPILREDNWPLLTVSKGFFESLAAGGAHSGLFHALHAALFFVSQCGVARIVGYTSSFAAFEHTGERLCMRAARDEPFSAWELERGLTCSFLPSYSRMQHDSSRAGAGRHALL